MDKRKFIKEGIIIWSGIVALLGTPIAIVTIKSPSFGLTIIYIILFFIAFGIIMWLLLSLIGLFVRKTLSAANKLKPKKSPSATQVSITILTAATSILMFIALGDNPYSFYTFLRFATFLSCGVIAYLLYKSDEDNPYIFVFGGIALLFNPFIPLSLSRELWSIVNFIIAIGLPICAILASKKR